MINFTCDRCGAHLAENDGYTVQVQRRMVRSGISLLVDNPDGERPFAGEMCAGCHDMFYVFFTGKFKEDGRVYR